MKELNHNTLHNAIRTLPEYEPPVGLWDSIEEALDAEEQLSQSVQSLPQYDPPAHIWGNLEAALPIVKPMPKPVLRGTLFRQILAVAAISLAVLGTWWLVQKNVSATGEAAIAVTVTQEALNAEVQSAAKENEDEGFDLVSQLCESKAPVCEDPDFKALKIELDDLTQAKNELRVALGSYGDDPTLASQLVQIERERSAVLRQMIQMI